MIYRNRELKIGDKMFSTVQGEVVVKEIDIKSEAYRIECDESYCGKNNVFGYFTNGSYSRGGPCCLFYPDEKPVYPPEPMKKRQWVMRRTDGIYFLPTKSMIQQKKHKKTGSPVPPSNLTFRRRMR